MSTLSSSHPATQQPGHLAPTGCVGTSVRRADRALTRLYDEALRPSGLATTQYALLATLARAEGPLRHHQLAAAQVMDGTTLTRTLAPLARDGLVQIAPGSDRRTRYVSLTPDGEAALERARPLWRAAQDRIVAEAGDEQIAALLDNLADLVTRIR